MHILMYCINKGPTQSATEYAQNLMELCSFDTVQVRTTYR